MKTGTLAMARMWLVAPPLTYVSRRDVVVFLDGGLVIELSGDRWDGESMDVSTTNGGVIMSVPENYSARIETGTVNGGVNTEFPVTVQGRITRQLALNLGSGGAPGF